MQIKDIVTCLDEWFPIELANVEDATKVGFTIGSKTETLQNILLTLDLTKQVIEEAINLNANLIIAHHPFPYYPLATFFMNDEHTQILEKMINNQISFYAAHTNMDVAEHGINDTLASVLELNNIKGQVKRDSYLRVGDIEPVSLTDFCIHVKEKFNIKGLKIVGSPNKMIKRVGIVGGSGCHLEEIRQAIEEKCDVYLTGEFKLSSVQYADFHQLAMMEIPHGLEKLGLNHLQIRLKNRLGAKYKVYISKINTDPIWFA